MMRKTECPVHSANHQANTGLSGPCFISTYISTYIDHHALLVSDVWCWCDDKVGTLLGSPCTRLLTWLS